jgi:hypothetical protein
MRFAAQIISDARSGEPEMAWLPGDWAQPQALARRSVRSGRLALPFSQFPLDWIEEPIMADDPRVDGAITLRLKAILRGWQLLGRKADIGQSADVRPELGRQCASSSGWQGETTDVVSDMPMDPI